MNDQTKPPSTALQTFRVGLVAMEPQFKMALPPHIPVERFTRVANTAVANNPDLLACTERSLWNAFMRAAQDGLLPDGREGAVVSYNMKLKTGGWEKTAQWMPMVYGILKKVRNSGQIAMITARVVYEGDQYRYWLDDSGEHILYEPSPDQNRDVVTRIFAAARTKDGELLVEPLTPADVEKIRNVSRSKDSGPWVSWWEEMAKKSAIRRLSKRLPMSSDLDDLIRRDDALYHFEKDTGTADEARPSLTLEAKLDKIAAPKQEPKPIEAVETVDAETGEVVETQATNSDEPQANGGSASEETYESIVDAAVKDFAVASNAEGIEEIRLRVADYLEDMPAPLVATLQKAISDARKRVAAAAEKPKAAAKPKAEKPAAANGNAQTGDLTEELAALARKKAATGTKRFKLFLNSSSKENVAALAPIMDELNATARQADEAQP